MPQMAPINWLNLFFMFTITYIMFCILNYFNFFLMYPTPPSKNFSSKNNQLTWKW
uniref:ATP synthase complex subunit 8 n=1 Tax=Coelophthinia sp. 1 JPL-2022a TaxID=3002427 RepID=A0A9E8MHX5_9DIPT|nr:ATP synthase F0 subunit 8 [Coelophthinia sp. 1 JPL-2022a]